MALAHARYGFLLRSIPVEMAGKFSATITAEALVVFAAALYLGLDTKVSWPGPACSMPATPVISVSGEALSSRAFRAFAISASFMACLGNCSKQVSQWIQRMCGPVDLGRVVAEEKLKPQGAQGNTGETSRGSKRFS